MHGWMYTYIRARAGKILKSNNLLWQGKTPTYDAKQAFPADAEIQRWLHAYLEQRLADNDDDAELQRFVSMSQCWQPQHACRGGGEWSVSYAYMPMFVFGRVTAKLCTQVDESTLICRRVKPAGCLGHGVACIETFPANGATPVDSVGDNAARTARAKVGWRGGGSAR